jgi:excisionase family DNA binding protein
LLDVQQAARRLRVSPDTVRRRIRDGQLSAYRVGAAGPLRIRAADVDGLLRPAQPAKGDSQE